MKRLAPMTLAALLMVSPVAHAGTWALDEAHTTIGFRVRHAMISNVRGIFEKVHGAAEGGQGDVTRSKGKIEIEVASINTHSEKRDGHLKSADFFDAEKYPTITFQTTRLVKHGKGLKITGDLSMHGVTKSITLEAEGPHKPVKDPFGMTRSGLSATGKLSRKDFGLKWNQAIETGGMLVADEIYLEIELEFVESKVPAPTHD